MPWSQKFIRVAVPVVIFLMIAWTVYAYLSPHEGDTISEWFWEMSKNPLIPFLAGMCAGHWFWPKS